MRFHSALLVCILHSQAVTVLPHGRTGLLTNSAKTCLKVSLSTKSLRGGGEDDHEQAPEHAAHNDPAFLNRHRSKPLYVIECSNCPLHRDNAPELDEESASALKRMMDISNEMDLIKQRCTELPEHMKADVERLKQIILNATRIKSSEEEPLRSRRYQPRYPRQRTLSPAERDAISRVRSSYGTANEPYLEEVFQERAWQRSNTPSSLRSSRPRVVAAAGARSRSKSENPSQSVEAVARGSDEAILLMQRKNLLRQRQELQAMTYLPPQNHDMQGTLQHVQVESDRQRFLHMGEEEIVMQGEKSRVVHGVLSVDEVERQLLETSMGKEPREEEKASSTSSARDMQGGALWHEEIERQILAGTPSKRMAEVEVKGDKTFKKGTKLLEDVEKELLMSGGRRASQAGMRGHATAFDGGQGQRSSGGRLVGREDQRDDLAKMQMKAKPKQVEPELRTSETVLSKTPADHAKPEIQSLLSRGDKVAWKIPQQQTTISSEFAASFPTLSEAADFSKKKKPKALKDSQRQQAALNENDEHGQGQAGGAWLRVAQRGIEAHDGRQGSLGGHGISPLDLLVKDRRT
mmetsp:Transcript_21506/g.48726  ORF Transcript_21506/g.48726 Transcript_21506/m.48726 type:complete len:577 (-) Transcript_21506:585-2315(-)